MKNIGNTNPITNYYQQQQASKTQQQQNVTEALNTFLNSQQHYPADTITILQTPLYPNPLYTKKQDSTNTTYTNIPLQQKTYNLSDAVNKIIIYDQNQKVLEQELQQMKIGGNQPQQQNNRALSNLDQKVLSIIDKGVKDGSYQVSPTNFSLFKQVLTTGSDTDKARVKSIFTTMQDKGLAVPNDLAELAGINKPQQQQAQQALNNQYQNLTALKLLYTNTPDTPLSDHVANLLKDALTGVNNSSEQNKKDAAAIVLAIPNNALVQNKGLLDLALNNA